MSLGDDFKLKNKLIKKKVLIIHGPNINLMGVRETSIYGKETIMSINQQITSFAKKFNFDCEIFQTNHEGEIVDAIGQSREAVEAIVLNAGAYSHYSLAIRDAIASIHIPCIEVHCSNIFARESFRSKSIISSVCAGTISGFGKYSYFLALFALKNMI